MQPVLLWKEPKSKAACGPHRVAIDTVRIDPENDHVGYTIIGKTKGIYPRGLYGSDIIDVVAEMVKT